MIYLLSVWLLLAALLVAVLGVEPAIPNVAKRVLFYFVSAPHQLLLVFEKLFARYSPASFLVRISNWFKS